MRIGADGRLCAINPEYGFFGVAPGTSFKTNPNMMKTLMANSFYPTLPLNVARETATRDPRWEGLDGQPPGGNARLAGETLAAGRPGRRKFSSSAGFGGTRRASSSGRASAKTSGPGNGSLPGPPRPVRKGPGKPRLDLCPGKEPRQGRAADARGNPGGTVLRQPGRMVGEFEDSRTFLNQLGPECPRRSGTNSRPSKIPFPGPEYPRTFGSPGPGPGGLAISLRDGIGVSGFTRREQSAGAFSPCALAPYVIRPLTFLSLPYALCPLPCSPSRSHSIP